MTGHTTPTPGPRTLADQIRACADSITAATLLDRPAIIAATLRDLAEKVRETETRAEQAERERDRQWQLKEIALGEMASVRLLAEQIKRYADWPGITDTATYPEIVESLRVCAAGLVRALDAGPRPDGPQRHAAAPAAAETDTEPRQAESGPQEAAGDVERVIWRLPQVWCEIYGVTVLDPDGWRHDEHPWDAFVTLAEFWRRASRSTVDALNPGWAALAADLKAQQARQKAATGYHANRRRQNPGGER